MTDAIQGRAIFISYRRDDSEGEAGRLYDDLVRAYGDSSVFMDVSGIEPGLDFRKAIDANVATCGVLLAMIGPTWVSVTDASGSRRLDNANDFVRLEIGSALARGVAVIPVLVHAAKMPPLDQLPDDLKDLRYRNSVELTHARWNSDVALLVTALKSYVTVNASHDSEPVHATIPVQLPAPAPAETPEHAPASLPVAAGSKLPLLVGILIAAVVILAVVVFATRSKRHKSTGQTEAQSAGAAGGSDQQGSGPPGASSPANIAAMIGRWKIAEEPKGGDDITQVEVTDLNGQLTVRAWGKCSPEACAWGPKNATVKGAEAVTESWDLRNNAAEIKSRRNATLTLRPSGDALGVTVHNIFHEPDGTTKENFHPFQFNKL